MAALRDSIDFGKENIAQLFAKMLLPTLLGMVSGAVFVITDGIFVGRGIGSNALAGVNFVSPLTLLSMGLGMMFGIGASVVATIHLANGKLKSARINMTQASAVASLILVFISLLVLLFPDALLTINGCSESLKPLAREYIAGFAPFMVCNGFIMMGGFFIRLNGAPSYAMFSSMIAAALNIILDYLFIFPLEMGVFGAALATGIGTTVGCVMMLLFLAKSTTKVHFYPLKLTKKSLQLLSRNVGYMTKLGAPSFFGHFSIVCMIMCGNVVFLREMGDDGVAAYSVIGYISPLMFTLYNAIAQSAQPIISYNYGIGNFQRVKSTLKLALTTAILYSFIPGILLLFFAPEIASLFISSDNGAYSLALDGLPIYAISLIPIAVNIVSIGYFQSVEEARSANIITIVRGYIFMIGCYATIPLLWGDTGAWLSTPLAECLTVVVIVVLFLKKRESLIGKAAN